MNLKPLTALRFLSSALQLEDIEGVKMASGCLDFGVWAKQFSPGVAGEKSISLIEALELEDAEPSELIGRIPFATEALSVLFSRGYNPLFDLVSGLPDPLLGQALTWSHRQGLRAADGSGPLAVVWRRSYLRRILSHMLLLSLSFIAGS